MRYSLRRRASDIVRGTRGVCATEYACLASIFAFVALFSANTLVDGATNTFAQLNFTSAMVASPPPGGPRHPSGPFSDSSDNNNIISPDEVPGETTAEIEHEGGGTAGSGAKPPIAIEQDSTGNIDPNQDPESQDKPPLSQN